MATLGPVSSPARRPFACLDGARLRNLTNVKNRQNANSVPVLLPGKRPHVPEEAFFQDAENIDPNITSPSKKAKTVDSISFYPTKPSKFVFKHAETTQTSQSNTRCVPAPSVKSAPTLPPAGRSPKSKRAGILSRRRSPFTRTTPPTFELKSNGLNGLPFSIDAALSGTVPSYVPESTPLEASTLEEKAPRGWLFEIHEDTPEEERGNLLQHGAQALDISDDESKKQGVDDGDKENIPPSAGVVVGIHDANNELHAASTVPVSRKDLMTEETRAPLSELDPGDLVESHDCNALLALPKESSLDDFEKPFSAVIPMSNDNMSNPSPIESLTGNQDAWKEILAQVDSTSKSIVQNSSSEATSLLSEATPSENYMIIPENGSM